MASDIPRGHRVIGHGRVVSESGDSHPEVVFSLKGLTESTTEAGGWTDVAPDGSWMFIEDASRVQCHFGKSHLGSRPPVLCTHYPAFDWVLALRHSSQGQISRSHCQE